MFLSRRPGCTTDPQSTNVPTHTNLPEHTSYGVKEGSKDGLYGNSDCRGHCIHSDDHEPEERSPHPDQEEYGNAVDDAPNDSQRDTKDDDEDVIEAELEELVGQAQTLEEFTEDLGVVVFLKQILKS